MNRYLQVNLPCINAGLSHQIHNLHQLLNYSYNNNLILILPSFRLIGKHNKGVEIKNNLTKYYDYDKLTINNKPYGIRYDKRDIDLSLIKIINIKQPEGELVNKDRQIGNPKKNKIVLPYIKEICEIAEKISLPLDSYTCIHVRRGDRLSLNKLYKDTSIPNILNKIKLCNLTNVYIMTDERNKNFINQLKSQKDYKIFFYDDFVDLKNIKDNYYLYCIEKVIMDGATKRVSTFDTKNKSRYEYFLSNQPGWQ